MCNSETRHRGELWGFLVNSETRHREELQPNLGNSGAKAVRVRATGAFLVFKKRRKIFSQK
jgi:hypothetical protein